jgi:hypothetical protein
MAYGRFLAAAATAALVSGNAWAGDPTAAVSAPTATVMAVGGSASGQGTGGGAAGVSFPITHSIGGQIDAALTKAGATGGGDAGLHLFTRDPNSYLVGTTFEFTRFGTVNSYRYGVEGEAYLGDFTIAPAGGIQRGGANKGTTTAGFASLEVDYYINDRLKTAISFGGYSSYRTVLAEAQWQPSEAAPFSLFVNAGSAVATDHHGVVLAGVRYTFGAPSSTIKERDRHGDPEILLQSGASSANLMGNTYALRPGQQVAPVAAPAAPIPN